MNKQRTFFAILALAAGITSLAAGRDLATIEAPEGMALVAGGSYVPLFVKDAEPRPVDSFFLDVDAVTNGEFLEFVRQHPEWRRSRVKALFADGNYLRHWAGDLDPGPEATAPRDAPVTNVSWFAARAYLKSQGKRLPTMDEWEYAARADATRADATADPAFTRFLLEWYGRPTPARIPPVESGQANVYQVRGLHGLVWEWVSDFNNAIVTGESRGDGSLERKLYCAAGAIDASDLTDYAAFMRYAFRSSLEGNYTVRNLGFRGARSINH